jgi:hypothetical protein
VLWCCVMLVIYPANLEPWVNDWNAVCFYALLHNVYELKSRNEDHTCLSSFMSHGNAEWVSKFFVFEVYTKSYMTNLIFVCMSLVL